MPDRFARHEQWEMESCDGVSFGFSTSNSRIAASNSDDRGRPRGRSPTVAVAISSGQAADHSAACRSGTRCRSVAARTSSRRAAASSGPIACAAVEAVDDVENGLSPMVVVSEQPTCGEQFSTAGPFAFPPPVAWTSGNRRGCVREAHFTEALGQSIKWALYPVSATEVGVLSHRSRPGRIARSGTGRRGDR